MASTNRLDHIGRRIQDKLNAASRKFKSRTKWRVLSATPRKFWDRRFIFRPSAKGYAFYDMVEMAFVRVIHDRIIQRSMANRSMAVDIVVEDGETRRKLHLTAGVAGNYERCIDDVQDKMSDWSQRYGLLGEEVEYLDASSVSKILEIVVFIGKRR